MRTNITCRGIPGLVLTTLLLACGDPKSSSTSGPEGTAVQTGQMTIDLKVESSESGVAVVRANLNDGRFFSTSYRLDGGDFFRACISGVCRTMADNDSVTSPDYIARFTFQPGIDYVVSFNRQQGQSAPDSRVALPPSFTLVTPANGQNVTDGETVIVEWSPTGAPARVILTSDADCPMPGGSHVYSSHMLGGDTNGDGREPVSIDSIISAARQSAPSPITRCSIDLTVRHELDGRIDPAFHGGTAVGIVSRKVSLDYIAR